MEYSINLRKKWSVAEYHLSCNLQNNNAINDTKFVLKATVLEKVYTDVVKKQNKKCRRGITCIIFHIYFSRTKNYQNSQNYNK